MGEHAAQTKAALQRVRDEFKRVDSADDLSDLAIHGLPGRRPPRALDIPVFAVERPRAQFFRRMMNIHSTDERNKFLRTIGRDVVRLIDNNNAGDLARLLIFAGQDHNIDERVTEHYGHYVWTPWIHECIGDTALIMCVRQRKLPCAGVLMYMGANPLIANEKGQNAIQVAESMGLTLDDIVEATRLHIFTSFDSLLYNFLGKDVPPIAHIDEEAWELMRHGRILTTKTGRQAVSHVKQFVAEHKFIRSPEEEHSAFAAADADAGDDHSMDSGSLISRGVATAEDPKPFPVAVELMTADPLRDVLYQLRDHPENVHELSTRHNLKYCPVGNRGMDYLAKALYDNRYVTHLRLGGARIGDTAMHILGALFAHNDVLGYVDLSCNAIGDEGAEKLCTGLARAITLDTLVLSRCRIGDQGARALVNAVAQYTCSVAHLWLVGNRNISEQCREELQALEDWPDDKTLHI